MYVYIVIINTITIIHTCCNLPPKVGGSNGRVTSVPRPSGLKVTFERLRGRTLPSCSSDSKPLVSHTYYMIIILIMIISNHNMYYIYIYRER